MRVIAWYPSAFGDSIISDLRARVAANVQVFTDEQPPLNCTVLIDGRPTEQKLESCPSLNSVIVPFAGVPLITRTVMAAHPEIALYNLHHNATETAETALALLLACAKRTVIADRMLRTGDWSIRYEPERTIRLEGKTTLIVGFGAIGEKVARVLLGVGMKVIATRKTLRQAETVDATKVHPAGDLRKLLPSANVLILAVPQTPETEGMIGKRELAMLPANAILVNVARAQVVDEQALYDALKSNHLHSAGLDVWYQYPRTDDALRSAAMPESAKETKPSNLPFWELDNMVMSPHRGGASADTEVSRAQHLATILNDMASGVQPPNRVDVSRGY